MTTTSRNTGTNTGAKTGAKTGANMGNAMGASPRKDWQDLAQKALKSDDLTRLNRSTEDQITIQPLYLAEDRGESLSDSLSATACHGWQMVQFIEPCDHPAGLNRAILDELEGGASGIILTPDQDIHLLNQAMDGVYLDAISVEYNAPRDAQAAAQTLMDLWQAHGISPEDACGAIGFDALAYPLSTGEAIDHDHMAATLKDLMASTSSWPNLVCVSIGGVKWHNMGLTPAEQLAASMAEVVMVLRSAEHHGIDLDAMVKAMRFTLAFDADLYQGLAKARAFRLVLSKLLLAAGLAQDTIDALPRQCHAITAERMMSRLDTDTNILRNGTAMLAASLSGFGVITTMPHDWLTGSTEQGRRIARNMHHLLADESQLGQVADPAQGSYFIDQLTAALAEKSWGMMQDIEAKGGLTKAIETGMIKGWASAAATARQARINTGQIASLGTTLHPVKGLGLAPVKTGALGARGGQERVTAPWEDLYQRMAGQSLRCLLLDVGSTDDQSKTASAGQYSRWFAAVGLDATMMTAEDLSHGQSIIASAKPDVLILGGQLAASMAQDAVMASTAPVFSLICDASSAVDYHQVMASVADAISQTPSVQNAKGGA